MPLPKMWQIKVEVASSHRQVAIDHFETAVHLLKDTNYAAISARPPNDEHHDLYVEAVVITPKQPELSDHELIELRELLRRGSKP